jgi:hypothetical protein
MDGTHERKETTRVAAPATSNTLSVNVFTAPRKAYGRRAAKTFHYGGQTT